MVLATQQSAAPLTHLHPLRHRLRHHRQGHPRHLLHRYQSNSQHNHYHTLPRRRSQKLRLVSQPLIYQKMLPMVGYPSETKVMKQKS